MDYCIDTHKFIRLVTSLRFNISSMKKQEEIVNQILARQRDDMFGFEVSEYIDFLDFDHAKSYLKDGVTEKEWAKIYKKPTKKNVLKAMKDYMDFAWEKANNCRGISANRSVAHYQAWIWLLDDGFLETFNEIEYENYGKQKLIAICEKYGWDWKKRDDGARTNVG